MITIEPKPENVKSAIALKCDNCYSAMAFANALAGSRDGAWDLCHAHTLKELLEHAKEKNISLDGLVAPVSKINVKDSLYYKRATEELSEQEFQSEFKKWQNGGK